MYLQQEDYSNPDDTKKTGLTPLSVKDFKSKVNNDVLILDTRTAAEFANGFIPGSLFIGLEGGFAEWAGNLIQFHQPIIVVTDAGKEEETTVRLARVGIDNVQGYLKGGIKAWEKSGEKIDMVIRVQPDELAMDIPFDENLVVVDVRKENEFTEGHVKDALNLPLNEMTDPAQIAHFEEDQNIYIHCGTGYRSLIAASIFKKHGYHNIRNVEGGWSKIKEEKNIKTEKEARVLN